MRYKLILCIVSGLICSSIISAQNASEEACKDLFISKLLLEYWGDAIPADTVRKYNCFFIDLLSNEKLDLNEVNQIETFPFSYDDNSLDEIKETFKYCIIVLRTKSKKGKVYKHVFILDNQLYKLENLQFLYSKNKVIYSDVQSSRFGVFRLLYFERKNQNSSSPPEVKTKLLFYFDEKNKLQNKLQNEVE